MLESGLELSSLVITVASEMLSHDSGVYKCKGIPPLGLLLHPLFVTHPSTASEGNFLVAVVQNYLSDVRNKIQ